jgi:hypothetical protein
MTQGHKSLKQLYREHKPVKLHLVKFMARYSQIFDPIRFGPMKILEIGVGGFNDKNKGGQSLKMWSEYFENSEITCIDINDKDIKLPENSAFYKGSQTDTDFLNFIVESRGPFDIVIDDASHVTKNTIASFEFLRYHTSRFYIVEDLHMKKAAGTLEYFSKISGSDFSTDHLCVVTIGK